MQCASAILPLHQAAVRARTRACFGILCPAPVRQRGSLTRTLDRVRCMDGGLSASHGQANQSHPGLKAHKHVQVS